MPVASYVVPPSMGYLMNSPLLFELLQDVQEAGYFQLLDIMPATAGLVEAFADQHCKLFLPGCLPALTDLQNSEELTEQQLRRRLRNAIGLQKGDNAILDVLLLWDLPNYLNPVLLSGLIDTLLSHTQHGTRLHCYIHTRASMPAESGVYTFTPGAKIWVEQQTEQSRTSPAYYQEALHKHLAPFVVERSILLSNGLQEYVLRRKTE